MSRCVCRRNAGRRERGGGEEGEGGVVGEQFFGVGGSSDGVLAMGFGNGGGNDAFVRV